MVMDQQKAIETLENNGYSISECDNGFIAVKTNCLAIMNFFGDDEYLTWMGTDLMCTTDINEAIKISKMNGC